MAVDASLRRFVRQRAGNRCEYCGLHQDALSFAVFHVEHIIAQQHGGTDSGDNLCLACHWCNFSKGTNIATREAGHLVPMFNPRTQSWRDHFEQRGSRIIGLTPVGRGTARLLNMNDEDRMQIRTP